MTIGLALSLLVVVLAACTISYGAYAQQNALPRGTLFYTEKPVFIALAYLVSAITRILYGAMHDHFSWWWFAGAILAFFIGPVVVLSALKEKTQIVGLLLTPILIGLAVFIK